MINEEELDEMYTYIRSEDSSTNFRFSSMYVIFFYSGATF